MTENLCPAHGEFSRRLDDRFRDHDQEQDRVIATLFEEVGKVRSDITTLRTQLAWLGGGLVVAVAIGRPIMEVVLQAFK